MAQDNQRKKLTQITTPLGVFRFPKLSDPDYGTEKFKKPDGEYSVQLVMKQDSLVARQLIETLNPHYQEALAFAKEEFDKLPVGTRKKLKDIQPNPFYTTVYDKETEEPTGDIIFKATMKASGVFKKGPKEGERWHRKPVIFDAKGNRMHRVPSIWGGTEGKIAVELTPYFVAGTGACGLKLSLAGVQIIKLVTANERSASSLGFGAEEGYEYDASDVAEADEAKDEAAADVGEGNF